MDKFGERLNKTVSDKQPQEMGAGSSGVFSGESLKTKAEREMYGESADYIAGIIRERISKDGEKTFLDIGSFKGELLKNILAKLPEYNIHAITLDTDEKALQNNDSAQEKIVADAAIIPLPDKSVDIIAMRYVLQWNTLERQEAILSEINRTLKGVAVIQHVGADCAETKKWRERMDDLLDGEEITKLKRDGHYYSSRDELETFMKSAGINFERLQDRKIDRAVDIFSERFKLTEDEIKMAEAVLGDRNYFYQTTWLITPTKEK
jgi:ubiquinone/menaquinone biosynthesis C-methylase UbiE